LGIDHQFEAALERHYEAIWGRKNSSYVWRRGPALPHECRVFEYAPSDLGPCWIYATCCMSPCDEPSSLELFLMSPSQTENHVELLTAIAHYHQTAATLDLGHTVNFGRPWLDQSKCSFGLISLPYLFGPKLENASIAGTNTRVLWLIPIRPEERAFKVKFGLEALEKVFEEKQVNCVDPMRESVVG
jgi:Suppressor of fused protein (SUFU)